VLKQLKLAKPAIDIGLFTNHPKEVSDFWKTRTRIVEDHQLSVSRTTRQFRYRYQDGILKINAHSLPLTPSTKQPLRRVIVANERLGENQDLQDPDGNLLTLCPMGYKGINHWAIEISAYSAELFFYFYNELLGFPQVDQNERAVQCGNSLITFNLEEEKFEPNNALEQLGLSYFTIQVYNVDTVYEHLVTRGVTPGIEPVTLGKTARIAFIRDPFGTWIELSQRASLTGALPSKV
jgi:catechol 2,3-dioxygenase-like lactoylglutathione lyase family enzyme